MIGNRTVNRRVRVKSGDGETDLGEGAYVGDVKVFFVVMPDGSLRSRSNAEEPPTPEEVPEDAEVVERNGNPKIVLDSGRTVYGCQVWWEYIFPAEIKQRVDGVIDRMLGAANTAERDGAALGVVSRFLLQKMIRKTLYEILMLEAEDPKPETAQEVN